MRRYIAVLTVGFVFSQAIVAETNEIRVNVLFTKTALTAEGMVAAAKAELAKGGVTGSRNELPGLRFV